jgi:hypothetical protein
MSFKTKKLKAWLAVVAAVALTGAAAVPANAGALPTVTADQTVIHSGEQVTFNFTGNPSTHDALFVNGNFFTDGDVADTPNPFDWSSFGCGADATITMRVYNEFYNGSSQPDWNTAYASSVDVTFAGDGSSTPCFGDPITATADQTIIHSGESVVFSTNADGANLAAFFVDGQFWNGGRVDKTPNPFDWGYFGCGSDVVGTYRVYDQPFDENGNPPDWNTPYAATVDVTFAGDGSSDACFGADAGNPFSFDASDVYEGQTVNLDVANVDTSQYAFCFEVDGAILYCGPGGNSSPGSQPISWDALTSMLAAGYKDLTQTHTVSITTYLMTDMDQVNGVPLNGVDPKYTSTITVHPAGAKANPWAWNASQISDGETATLTYAGQPSSEIGCWAVDGVAYDCGPMNSTDDNVLTWSDIQDMLTNYGLDTSVQHTFTAVSYDPADVDQSTYLPLTGVTALYQADITWMPSAVVNPWAWDASQISTGETANLSYTGDPGSEVGCWLVDGVAYGCQPVGSAFSDPYSWGDIEGMLGDWWSLDTSVQHTLTAASYSVNDIDQGTGLPATGATALYQADITWIPAPEVNPWTWSKDTIDKGETVELTFQGNFSSYAECVTVDGVIGYCIPGGLGTPGAETVTWDQLTAVLQQAGMDLSVSHTIGLSAYLMSDMDQNTGAPLDGVDPKFVSEITINPAPPVVNPWAFDESVISENGNVNVSYAGNPGSEVGCWAIDGVVYGCEPVGQSGTNNMTWADFEGMLEQYSLDTSVQHTFSVMSYNDGDIDQGTGLPSTGATSLYQADITWMPGQVVVDPVPSGTYDVAPNGKGATLNWTPSQTATSYIVKVGGQVVTTLDSSAITYTLSGLVGPADDITVIAVNGNNQSVAASLTYVKKDYITLGGLTFKGDSAKLSSASKKALARYAALVAQHGFTEVEAKAYFKAAKGYTAKFVAKLQKTRAAAIRSYLLSQFKKLGASVKVIAKAGGKFNRYGVVSTR